MAERGNILVCCEHFPAVSETFVLEHVLGLHRAGWQVRVACLTWDGAAWARICAERLVEQAPEAFLAVEYAPRLNQLKDTWLARHLFLIKRFGLLYGRRTSGLMRREKIRAGILRIFVESWRPDVVHAHFGPNAVQAAVAVRDLGIPLIAEFHGHDVTSFPLKRGWDLYRTHLHGCKAIVHSAFVEHLIQDNVGLGSERVTFGIDTSRFKPPARSGSWPRPIRMLHVGRLIYQKGQEVAIRAMKLLPDHDLSLTLVGEGDALGELEALCQKLNLEDRVEFRGAVSHDEVAALMAGHDILVVPSRRGPTGSEEAFCIVAAEGLTMGMGVIGTKCGGLPDTVGDGGIVLNPDDSRALADGILRMLENTPEAWARRAQESAKRFDVARMHAEYDRIARKAAGTNGN